MKFLKALFLGVILIACQNDHEGDILLINTAIIDIETGEVSNHDVLIKDSLITVIANGNSLVVKSNRVIDGSGHFLIPGLWDMHVHIQDSTYLSMFLDYGITGVRDMGGCVTIPTDGCESLCPEDLNRWKAAIMEGKMDGPKLYISGSHLSGTGWPTSLSVSTKEEVNRAFQQNRTQQVDFIKVYEKVPWESYKEISRLSKHYNLDFVGHVSKPYLLSDILDLGQKSIEHIREPILYSFTDDSHELEEFMTADNYTKEDREYVQHWIDDAENVMDAFKRNKAWFTPTMAVEYARQRYGDMEWIQHPLRDELPSSVREGLNLHLERMKINTDKKGDSLWWFALTKLVKRFAKEKIGILAGSDSACEGGIPGFSLHEELFLMVEKAGLSPLEALQTAISNPCTYFALDNNGKVHEGYYADLILLSKNPLESIRNTLSIKAVIKEGKLVRFN